MHEAAILVLHSVLFQHLSRLQATKYMHTSWYDIQHLVYSIERRPDVCALDFEFTSGRLPLVFGTTYRPHFVVVILLPKSTSCR